MSISDETEMVTVTVSRTQIRNVIEAARILTLIERGKIKCELQFEGSGGSWANYRTSNGWKISAFHDNGGFDYIEEMISPDGFVVDALRLESSALYEIDRYVDALREITNFHPEDESNGFVVDFYCNNKPGVDNVKAANQMMAAAKARAFAQTKPTDTEDTV